MKERTGVKKGKIFYGYYILAGAFVCQLAVNGFDAYSFSLFVNPLEAQFHWSRADIMFALIIANLVKAVVSPIAGQIIDRHGVRQIMAAGAVMYSIAFLLLSKVNSLWQLYLLYGLIGVANVCIAIIPLTALVFNWFKKRRGLAVGIMGAGIGTGGLIVAPIIGGVIIPNSGWATAYIVISLAMVAIILPIVAFVFKAKPADMGLNQDGVLDVAVNNNAENNKGRTHSDKEIPEGGLTLQEARKKSAFWFSLIAFFLMGLAQGAMFQNHAPHLRDIGFDAATAAFAVSIGGLGSAFGKVFFGILTDRTKPKFVLLIGLVMLLSGTIILTRVTTDSSRSLIFLYAIVLGIGIGCWLPSLSMITSSTFGMAHYGAIFGMATLAFQLGSAVGPFTAGKIFDATGGYELAFLIFGICFVVAMPLTILIRRPKW